MSATSHDWAFWDDTYIFAQGLDDEYIETNLLDVNFDLYAVDVIMFVDNSGRILYGKHRDFETEEIKDIDADISNLLLGLGIFKNKNPETAFRELVIVEGIPLMIASNPILKSDGSGPAMGNVMFGRNMDTSMMEEISDKLGLKTSFKLMKKGNSDLAENINISSIEIDMVDNNNIVGSYYLPEMLQQDFIKISAKMPRDVMEIGRNSIGFLMVLLPIILISTLMLLLYVLDKLVLSRIIYLNGQVTQIKAENAVSARVDVDDGHDEISQLSDGINLMLDGLEDMQLKITEAKNTLEITVIDRTRELIIANQQLEDEIIERQKIQDKVSYLAYFDTLTGLPNRLLLTDRVNQAIKLANRHEIPISIMFIDLDRFKIINDTLGHNQGDELLKQVATRLSRIARKNDTISRLGGDEFIILINGYNDENNLDTIALKVMDSFKTPFMVMYEAKSLGKNQYKKCSKASKDSAIETMVLTNSLHRAVERGEMMLYYQPQVNGLTGEIEGVEALLRWKHPELGFIQPTKFIPLAEKTGLILPIGNWVLITACRQCKSWQEMGFKHIRMAVNFSIHQVNDPTLIEQVADILTDFSLQPDCLEFELTESIAMNLNGTVKETLKQLKKLGVTLSIDDFGTEYSSLSRIKDLPIDRVKIDMSFIQGIGKSEKDEAITKTVIMLANSLELKTIAEGVETREQLDFLNSRMCDEVQGFYIYEPMPAEEMEKLLREIS